MLKKLNLKGTTLGQQTMQNIGLRFEGLSRLALAAKTEMKLGIASEAIAQDIRHTTLKL